MLWYSTFAHVISYSCTLFDQANLAKLLWDASFLFYSFVTIKKKTNCTVLTNCTILHVCEIGYTFDNDSTVTKSSDSKKWKSGRTVYFSFNFHYYVSATMISLWHHSSYIFLPITFKFTTDIATLPGMVPVKMIWL